MGWTMVVFGSFLFLCMYYVQKVKEKKEKADADDVDELVMGSGLTQVGSMNSSRPLP
jgi:hypothetical protein